LTRLPYQGRGESSSPLLAGEGLGERFAQIPITIPPTLDPSPQRPIENLSQPQIPTPAPPSEELIPTPIPPTPEPMPGEIPETITVKEFDFEDNTVITDAELAEVTAKFLNRSLSFAEVFEVRSVITKLYKERGYITSGAIIPAQTFQPVDGVVKIKIIEGGLESINVTGTEKLNPEYIRSRIAMGAGVPLNRTKLIEVLQLLQLDPLIANISGELAAGTRSGASVLTVQVEEAKTFFIDLSSNNNRSPSIGTWEREITMTEANFLGNGDRLSFGYSHTEGSNTFDASYIYPINPRNGTLSGRVNFGFSNVVEPPFDRIDIDADSQYYELTWRQPLRQTLNREFTIGVTASHQSSNTTIFNIPFRLSPGADEDGGISVTALRFFTEWINRSNKEVFSARSQFTLGLGILGATTNDSAPDSNFLSWRGQTQWVRLLGKETLLILGGDVQLATSPLLRLEQFGLGGQDTLRGYRQSSFLTDNGLSMSGELRFPLFHFGDNGLLQLAPFVDAGMVWNNSGNPDPDPDPNILVSTGLGLRLNLGSRFSARVDWGIPLVDVNSSGDTLQEDGFYFSVNYRLFN
ncbi:MAG TPA: peptide transporter, partial [Cyanobacteria bacterium UBA11153]|nr:peptide transporter [Cyanobacteria bacterium UBA11153]